MSLASAFRHCGAVRFEVGEPEWVLDFNCSHCRLYGALWAYYPQMQNASRSMPASCAIWTPGASSSYKRTMAMTGCFGPSPKSRFCQVAMHQQRSDVR